MSKINVTKTFLPDLKEYVGHLEKAWDNVWLTNRGELVLELEDKIAQNLRTEKPIIMTNGTLPIQIALKVLCGNGGEIITTPFSYVATTSAIVWEGFNPVFVDIETNTFSINASKIEQAITSHTKAILATHVFGNPCDVERISEIARKHNLCVIYDAAHCYGVEYNGKSIFEFGDISTCSFHATKLFHTGEGGALFCKDERLKQRCFQSHNFGHNGPTDFSGVGINGKISELQAAMGLAVLPHIDNIIGKRKKLVDLYQNQLHSELTKSFEIRGGTSWNYSYYPILFRSEDQLVQAMKDLNKNGIYPRRYFYPSLNTLKYVKSETMPVAESIAQRILCLPLYAGLSKEEVFRIIEILNYSAK